MCEPVLAYRDKQGQIHGTKQECHKANFYKLVNDLIPRNIYSSGVTYGDDVTQAILNNRKKIIEALKEMEDV